MVLNHDCVHIKNTDLANETQSLLGLFLDVSDVRCWSNVKFCVHSESRTLEVDACC